MKVDESLERYRTIVFGVEIMRAYIKRFAWEVDATFWWAMVPECYHAALVPILQEVLARHYGEKLDDSRLEMIVLDLNATIAQQLEPVMPS